MRRQIIAVDLDGVLSASAEGFAAYSNERWGGDHKAENYPEEWAVFWGVSLEEALIGEYKWNQAVKLPTGITRARTWNEVKEYFDAQS